MGGTAQHNRRHPIRLILPSPCRPGLAWMRPALGSTAPAAGRLGHQPKRHTAQFKVAASAATPAVPTPQAKPAWQVGGGVGRVSAPFPGVPRHLRCAPSTPHTCMSGCTCGWEEACAPGPEPAAVGPHGPRSSRAGRQAAAAGAVGRRRTGHPLPRPYSARDLGPGMDAAVHLCQHHCRSGRGAERRGGPARGRPARQDNV